MLRDTATSKLQKVNTCVTDSGLGNMVRFLILSTHDTIAILVFTQLCISVREQSRSAVARPHWAQTFVANIVDLRPLQLQIKVLGQV